MSGPFEMVGETAPTCEDGVCALPDPTTITVEPASDEPPFEQVRRQVSSFVASGAWEPGRRMPTVRALADELGLAVNTIAKAYKALEADGTVETHGRHGTIVATRRTSDPEAAASAAQFVAAARRQGLSRPEAHRLVDDAWS